MDANYKMTVNLFEACLDNNLNPKIHIPGSGEEYGEIYEHELPITLDTTLRPVNPLRVWGNCCMRVGFLRNSFHLI